MIYLVTLEPLENRYTGQWKKWIKEKFINDNFEVVEIDGNTLSKNNKKSFLNFNLTNTWKSEQIIKIADLFNNNIIQNDDIFLWYDAWHYGIIALKYMSALNNIKVK